MPRVSVDVTANGTVLERVLKRAEGQVHHFKDEASKAFGSAGTLGAGSGLIGGLAGAIGGQMLAGMVEHMADFGHEILEVADRLEISTDSAQRLKAAADDSGKSLEFLENAINKTGIWATKALHGNSKEANQARALGISQSDLQSKSELDLLKQAIQGAKALGMSNGAPLLDQISGKKTGRSLMNMDFAAYDNMPVLSQEEIEKLAQIKKDMNAISRAMTSTFGPIIADIYEWVAKAAIGLVGLFKALWAFSKMIYDLPMALFTSDPIGNIKDVFKTFKEEIVKIAEEQPEVGSDKTKHKTTTTEPTDKVNRAPSIEENKVKPDFLSNEFLKMGNAIGVDEFSRITSLAQTTNDWLQKIEENTRPKAEPELKQAPLPNGFRGHGAGGTWGDDDSSAWHGAGGSW